MCGFKVRGLHKAGNTLATCSPFRSPLAYKGLFQPKFPATTKLGGRPRLRLPPCLQRPWQACRSLACGCNFCPQLHTRLSLPLPLSPDT